MNFLGKSKTGTVISSSGKVTVNGVIYEGNNITITNNKVFIDGQAVESSVSRDVKVEIEGSPVKVYSDASVEVKGDVLGDVDSEGSVSCGNVRGNVDAGGSVSCGNVGGDVDAGGRVNFRK
ncbi:hypothetical protein FZC77_22345 [Bacillus swezeyi]|uniref:Polymer-forming cytoskeletal protein n=1 Tax=Bacillus swezeyi TaxID=1925020 RepID=A0A5M8RGZ3_9BACI|nr:hypothetical protein DX927_23750 [Bacillus swezeyi]KAA6472155.1 hypothetical protein DX928_22270 [Bacillus swezeyi]TYS32375.1 hypothetical protein FZC77_22345 [Bacillus swezeyi]